MANQVNLNPNPINVQLLQPQQPPQSAEEKKQAEAEKKEELKKSIAKIAGDFLITGGMACATKKGKQKKELIVVGIESCLRSVLPVATDLVGCKSSDSKT